MSALGQKQTFALQKGMSALPPKADMCSALGDVRFGPKADIYGLEQCRSSHIAASVGGYYRCPKVQFKKLTSNKGPGAMRSNVTAGDVGKRSAVNHFKHAILPTNRLAKEQSLERLIGVHQRHAEGVGQVLLREWKLDTSVLDQAGLLRPDKQMQEQIGSALKRGPATQAHEMFIDELLLACRKPRDVIRQRGKPTIKVP